MSLFLSKAFISLYIVLIPKLFSFSTHIATRNAIDDFCFLVSEWCKNILDQYTTNTWLLTICISVIFLSCPYKIYKMALHFWWFEHHFKNDKFRMKPYMVLTKKKLSQQNMDLCRQTSKYEQKMILEVAWTDGNKLFAREITVQKLYNAVNVCMKYERLMMIVYLWLNEFYEESVK